ncbi:Saccharopine dehydrogenase-like oxidoreductase [Halotydeus destructor]|nr:Saccharopine dehydrogenase-like oxidoreductase [Halotydeus destructor]
MIGSYYALLALEEYFAYETVTKTTISPIAMTDTVYLVCAPQDNHMASNLSQAEYLRLENFSSSKLVCMNAKTHQRPFNVSDKMVTDMTVYALDSLDAFPWNLNSFNQIYGTEIDSPRSNSCFVISISFRRFEAGLLSLPYHTDCFEYDQHECRFHCLKKRPKNEHSCSSTCSKASCTLRHADSISWNAYADKDAVTSQVEITQVENVIHTEFSPKSSLGSAAVNVFGLGGVFIGLSALDLVHCARRLVFQPSRPVKRSAVLLLYLAGFIHAVLVVEEYLQYGYATEVYQGKNVQQPKHAYAICIPGKYDGAHWSAVKDYQVPFGKVVSSIWLLVNQGKDSAFYEDSLEDSAAQTYVTKYVTAFTRERQLCYRSKMPSDVPEGMLSEPVEMTMFSEIDYTVTISTALSGFHVTAFVEDNDLILSNLYYQKLSGDSIYRLLYSEIQSLPYPFKTACENYGQGTWEGTMSRQHCAERCALKKFKMANPGLSPEDLPLVGSWNRSAIGGRVEPFISGCLAIHCRQVDCIFKKFSLSAINARPSTILSITVVKPNESAFLFKHVPSTGIVDTILLVISVLGIWTGFSLMHVKNIVHRSLRKSHATRRNRTRVSHAIKLVITILFALNIYTVVHEYAKYDFITQSVCRKAFVTKNFVMLMRYHGLPKKGESGRRSSPYLVEMVKDAWFRHPRTLAWSRYTSEYLANITSVYRLSHVIYLAIEMDSSLDKLNLDVSGSMSVFRLDIHDFGAAEMYLTSSSDDMSQGDFSTSMTILPASLNVVAMFESLTVTSLPAPYVFACVDYPKYGYRNQRNCTNSCIREQGIKKYNGIDDNLVLVNMADEKLLAPDHRYGEQLGSYCTSACSHSSCSTKIHLTRQSRFIRRQGSISIYVDSNVQETQLTYLAKMAINEFIMYLAELNRGYEWLNNGHITDEQEMIVTPVTRKIQASISATIKTSRASRLFSSATGRYDAVIFGASGFTGEYLVEDLAKFISTSGKQLRWAVAGRSRPKVSEALDSCSRRTGLDLSQVPIIEADVNKVSSLSKLAASANVLINCIGPFRHTGEPIVRACLEHGTHYLDITGEPEFMEIMQLKYFKEAQRKKVYIINSCGYDSVPCDLSVNFLRDNFDGELVTVETYLALNGGKRPMAINGTTWHSAVDGVAGARNLRKIRKQLFSDVFPNIPRDNNKYLEKRPFLFRHTDDVTSGWGIRFAGADRSVVQRSQAFNFRYYDEKPVAMDIYSIQDFRQVMRIVAMGASIAMFGNFESGREFLKKFPDFFTAGMLRKGGVSRDEIALDDFTLTSVGRGFSDISRRSGKLDKEMIVRIRGPHPGYPATTICVIQTLMTLLEESHLMPKEGGVLTPGAAFRKTSLLERLKTNGLSVEVIRK